MIAFRVPHNGAVQIYDYKLKKSRVIFGPDLVMLGPDEQVSVTRSFELSNKVTWRGFRQEDFELSSD